MITLTLIPTTNNQVTLIDRSSPSDTISLSQLTLSVDDIFRPEGRI